MVSASGNQEFESDYEVSYRELASPAAGRDLTAKDRLRARSRFTRGGKGRIVNGAHRRRDKRNYL